MQNIRFIAPFVSSHHQETLLFNKDGQGHFHISAISAIILNASSFPTIYILFLQFKQCIYVNTIETQLSNLYIINLLKLYYKLYRNRLPTYCECFLPEYECKISDSSHPS